MNKSQIEKFETITKELTKLSLIHTHNLNINEALFLVWFEILEDWEAEQIKAGFKIVGQTCKGFPTPAHIIEAIKEQCLNHPNPEAAYLEAFKKCSSLSWGDNAPEYSSAALEKAIQLMGGCMRIAELTNHEVPFYKRRFLSTYKEVIEKKDFSLKPVVIGQPAEVKQLHPVKNNLPQPIDIIDYANKNIGRELK